MAIIVIAIALIAAVGMLIQSSYSTAGAEGYTAAAALAQEQLELLKAQPASYWNSIPGPTSRQVTLGNIVYTITTTASPSPEDSSKMVDVAVTVTWTDRGAGRQVTVTGAFAHP